MAESMKILTVKTPKPVYLNNVSDFGQFEETLKALCQKFLSPNWEWTFKVGGKVQRDIERRDPDNEGIQIINKQTNVAHFDKYDVFNEKYTSPLKRETGDVDEHKASSSFPPEPPPPIHVQPLATVSKAVAEAMGKRPWQVEKMKDEGRPVFQDQ